MTTLSKTLRFYFGNPPPDGKLIERFICPSLFEPAGIEKWGLYVFPAKQKGPWCSLKLVAEPKAVWVKGNYWLGYNMRSLEFRRWRDEGLLVHHRPALADGVLATMRTSVQNFADFDGGVANWGAVKWHGCVYDCATPDDPYDYLRGENRTLKGSTKGSSFAASADRGAPTPATEPPVPPYIYTGHGEVRGSAPGEPGDDDLPPYNIGDFGDLL